jgi:thioredoxin:protein disulfide reductase
LKLSKFANFSCCYGLMILLGALASQIGVTGADTLIGSTDPGVEQDLLEPTRAFELSARQKGAGVIELRYKIADGYYMYASKFKFAVESGSAIKLGKARLSKGSMKQDPTFGRVETFRNSVRILLPITRMHNDNTDAQPLHLRITSQGCADAGVCFPPLQQTLIFPVESPGVVFPVGETGVGSLGARLEAKPAAAQHSLSDALRKTDKP